MKPDTLLDYAVFQLSPRRSRCELFVSSDGNTEKLASGLVKPFVTHLKVAEEQVALAVQSIKLQVERRKNAETWFTKGTLERFVRFVSTPEVLEMVNTFDAEMSQLEAARRIYSQGTSDQQSSTLGRGGTGSTAAADATKKELLRAIDVRLVAVRQDLTAACSRSAAAGFNPDTVFELQMFAERFGAHRLNEACSKFISFCERRRDLINPWKTGLDDRAIRSSYGSDMSIDEDPTTVVEVPHPQPQHLDQPTPSTCQQQPTFPSRRSSRESSVEQEDAVEREKKEQEAPVQEGPEPVQTGPPARRLSVQDRISLFENKQKETSSTTAAGGSGGKPVVAKPAHLRRLSSDVSSAPAAVEKAVLRRWSGASDMSIDLSGEKKETESSLCTPSSSTATSAKPEFKSLPSRVKDKDEGDLTRTEQLTGFSGRPEEALESNRPASSKTESRPYLSKAEDNASKDQPISQAQFSFSLGGRAEPGGSTDQSIEPIGIHKVASETQIALSRGESLETGEDVGSRSQSIPRLAPLRATVGSGQLESGSGSKIREAFVAQFKGAEADLLASQARLKTSGDVEAVGRKELCLSEGQPDGSLVKVEDSGLQRMKFQKQVSVPEQIKKSHGRREESKSVNRNSKTPYSGKMVAEDQEAFVSMSMTPVEQVQRVRQSKGNQELNDELKLKANELEKLFAEHKLRVPVDQANTISTKRSKPAEMQIEQASSVRNQMAEIVAPPYPDKNTVIESSGSSSLAMKSHTSSLVNKVDGQDYIDALKPNFSELGFSDDSKGNFYNRYMQKRDAKLREEWSSKGVEKEAKMKAMQDRLDRSRAEMRAKFSGSADKNDSVSTARRRAERLRSFNSRSATKREQPLDFVQSEDDEDPSIISEEKLFGQERSFSEVSSGDGASRSSLSKKLLPNRNLSSSTPRTLAAPVPRSATKASNFTSGRRRMQSENPLAQSVPNFSDLRKENTKPYSVVSKTTRPQLRNYSRSKSTSEEMAHVKEEKARRSQSLRKSSASPAEFKDVSPLQSEGVVLTPLRFGMEQTEQSLCEKLSKNVESKPFLRKNNGIGPGAGASIAKLKAAMMSEEMNNAEESDELPFEQEDLVDVVKDEEDEEFEIVTTEDHANFDHEEPRLSLESDKLANSGSENGDELRPFNQVDPSFVAELPAALPSTFHPVGSAQDSPGESPMSWNSRIQHPFSYPHEASDVDASADSPMGSPASWNLHSLNQTEADAARMRKKWGSAQKPVIVANSSNSQSRKDMTKGFKRLLKFGRKPRGTENLADWVSATTSEGDDDTEDGRDPANRSSEDLRKSRMGFSQGHPSEDSFNESEFFGEQVQALRSSIPTPPANFKLRDEHLSGSSMKGDQLVMPF
ncbi:hypothetical protein RJ640_008368 [Escallonia rubra]|uniref:COP1-interacting protein 7 n=1 Tax=Escallonia rubra TaxID=112253 RepID=A0AA88QNI6_9ASTE|nr:hypothetical protein RJ640_008368 [Escallonia rubra]